MPRANAIYIEALRSCVTEALGRFELPMMIPTADVVRETRPLWEAHPMGKFVEINAVVVGRMMARLGFAQVHGPMFNGWWVERV